MRQVVKLLHKAVKNYKYASYGEWKETILST